MYGAPGPNARRRMAAAWGPIILDQIRAQRRAKTKRFAIVAAAAVAAVAIVAGVWYALAS